jgi:hypothetical protein
VPVNPAAASAAARETRRIREQRCEARGARAFDDALLDLEQRDDHMLGLHADHFDARPAAVRCEQ